MNKFEKQLEKWNNGTLRGAQAKLAKCLQVSTAIVALWANGKRRPSKGYIAKMAQLFKLDLYDVSALFSPVTQYSSSLNGTKVSSLRDAPSAGMYIPSLTPAPGTVALPVFVHLPPHALGNSAHKAKAWWVIPSVAAQGAQFLFPFPEKTDPNKLLFIKPSGTWMQKQLMLARGKRAFQLVYVTLQQGKIALYSPQGKSVPIEEMRPIGIVVKQLTTPIFPLDF